MLTTATRYKLPKGCALGLKVVYADGRPESDKAPKDFRWPVALGKGGRPVVVTAPDWNDRAVCGGGLHLWPWTAGDLGASGIYTRDDETVVWLAIEYVSVDAIDLDGKSKIPTGRLVAHGARGEVATWIQSMAPDGTRGNFGTATAGDSGTATAGNFGTATAGYSGTATAGYLGTATAGNFGTATAGNSGTATAGNFGTATAGNSGTATAGNSGTATAGDSGTATAGDSGTATAGNSGTATAGDSGTATAGNSGTATAGYLGTATAGDSGTATAGDSGTATAGNFGTATAGDSGTATAGDSGTATAGNSGTATAGDGGSLSILWYDDKQDRWRRAVAEVDGVAILPGVPYHVIRGQLVRKEPA